MLIQVLGTGCTRCKNLYEAVLKAVKDCGIEATVEKVEDIEQIMAFELIMTPALVIDGEVKLAGRLPSVDEIKNLIFTTRAA